MPNVDVKHIGKRIISDVGKRPISHQVIESVGAKRTTDNHQSSPSKNVFVLVR